MKKFNQQGFSAIEALLLLVVIAIIGGTGYVVWHARQATNDSLDNSAQAQPALQTKTTKAVSTAPANAQSKVLASYDPVETPNILPTLSTNMKAKKLLYNYMIIGEWSVKASTIDTTNIQLPYYLNYRPDIADSANKTVSMVIFSGANDSGNDKTCADGANGPVVYLLRDTSADALGYTSFKPISDLNVGGHVYHVYEDQCTSNTNSATASAIERQLETLAVN